MCSDKEYSGRKGCCQGIIKKKQDRKIINLNDNKDCAAEIGDNVLTSVPEVDHGQSDTRNVLGVILNIIDNDFYKVELYTRSQLNLAKEELVYSAEVDPEECTLREISRKICLFGGQGYKKCNCKSKRITRKCLCQARNKLCNSKWYFL